MLIKGHKPLKRFNNNNRSTKQFLCTHLDLWAWPLNSYTSIHRSNWFRLRKFLYRFRYFVAVNCVTYANVSIDIYASKYCSLFHTENSNSIWTNNSFGNFCHIVSLINNFQNGLLLFAGRRVKSMDGSSFRNVCKAAWKCRHVSYARF